MPHILEHYCPGNRMRMILVPKEEESGLLAGVRRIVNVPSGSVLASSFKSSASGTVYQPGYRFTERFADSGMFGILISHPTFAPLTTNVDIPTFRAVIEDI